MIFLLIILYIADMGKLTVSARWLFVLFLLASLGCSHIAHRANVNEGVNFSVLAAPSHETYDPPNRDYYNTYEPDTKFSGRGRTDFQISCGYAWKLRNTRKLMTQLNFAIAPEDGQYLPSAGIYYQASPDYSESAAGFGALIGVDPVGYFIWGRDFAENSDGWNNAGVDIAVGMGSGPSYLANAMLFYRHRHFQLGLFSEYRYFSKPFDLCDENCDYSDYIKSRLSFGIIFIPGETEFY